MANVIDQLPLTLPKRESNAILLHGIEWRTYVALAEQLEKSGQHAYLTFDRGTLEIMSPSRFHEKYKKIVGRLVEMISMELKIPIDCCGSTTFRREDIERGIEPDECYYVQNAGHMAHKTEIDMLLDPPPDLAMEMDISPHLIDRESVYAALGVPEIWQFDGEILEGLHRDEQGVYQSITHSVAFPFLPLAVVQRFLTMWPKKSEYDLFNEFRQFIRSEYPARPG